MTLKMNFAGQESGTDAKRLRSALIYVHYIRLFNYLFNHLSLVPGKKTLGIP